jgi:hypothetical protein
MKNGTALHKQMPCNAAWQEGLSFRAQPTNHDHFSHKALSTKDHSFLQDAARFISGGRASRVPLHHISGHAQSGCLEPSPNLLSRPKRLRIALKRCGSRHLTWDRSQDEHSISNTHLRRHVAAMSLQSQAAERGSPCGDALSCVRVLTFL